MTRRMFPPRRGFTLIELMVVVSVIAILAMMAVPTFRERIVRKQVAETLDSLEFVRNAIGARYVGLGVFPKDNDAAGLPPADKIVGSYVSDVTVTDGVFVVTFGNGADGALKGKRVSVRPAFVAGYPQVPLVWLCAAAAVPAKMTVQGADATDVPVKFLPMRCLDTTPKPS